ncbi:MAG TPA: condensation domain-containing protein, partial [Candidatus Polarisedimenticolaceae bacterium]|nr:condensation domain-containing protein [Candidatus Polarisedimenticolaceae bacterium]
MRDVVERLANLSPEKRARLARALEERGTEWSTFPLSFAQQRLWFLDRWEPGSSAYNLPAALRLRGALDLGALEASLGEITRRHEALRTTFPDIDGKPIQVVGDAEPFRIPVLDLRSLGASERKTRARALAAEEAERPFDLARGPVFRATALRLAEKDHVLLLTLHHIVADGWSLAILVEELNALYAAFSSAKPSPLSELSLQYGDFVLWQRELLRGPAIEDELAYWRRRLQGAPELLPLPTDRPRPLARSSSGAARAAVVPDPLASALRDLGRREGATSFMTLLAAFVTLLHRITGQTDLVVGTPVAGRTRPETERLIGFFVNTLALRCDLSGGPTFREVLRRVRETALEALAHQHLPFERLVEEIRPERDPGRTPIVQVMFAMQNAPAPSLDLPGLSMEAFDSAYAAAKFDWTLSADEEDDGFHLVLVYATDLFDEATIDRMLGHLVRLVRGVVEDPDRRVGELTLLTEGERESIVSGWNATR